MNDRIVQAWLAQLVERSYVKRETRGSSPGSGLHFSVISLLSVNLKMCSSCNHMYFITLRGTCSWTMYVLKLPPYLRVNSNVTCEAYIVVRCIDPRFCAIVAWCIMKASIPLPCGVVKNVQKWNTAVVTVILIEKVLPSCLEFWLFIITVLLFHVVYKK